jgi:hypothetical protein
MAEVNCPVDGCDYTGPVGSVEGHISASQSGGHQGEVGRHFREDLVERAERSIGGGATDSVEVAESPDGSGGDYRPEGGGDASDSGPRVPPGKAVVASTLILLLSAFGSSGGGSDDGSDDTESVDLSGGLLDE